MGTGGREGLDIGGWGLGGGKALTLIKQHWTVAPTHTLVRVGTGVGEGLDIDKAAL